MAEPFRQDNKRIAKNTLLLYGRMLLMLGISLYTSRVVLRILGVDDYGIYHVVGGVVTILSFLNTSMAGATQRFLNVALGEGDQEGVNKVFRTAQFIHICVAGIVLILGETIGLWYLNTFMNIPVERMTAANWVYQFSVLSFLVGIVSVPYNSCLIAHERMSAFAYISVLEAVLKLVIVFTLSLLPTDRLITYAFLLALTGVLLRVIYGIYCKHRFEECRHFSLRYDKAIRKQMVGFSGWTIFGALGTISHTQGIALVINYFFGVAVNAAQGIAHQVNAAVSGFVTNFMVAVNPQIVKSYAASDYEAMHVLMMRGCKMGFFLLCLFVVPLIYETPFVLKLWLHEYPDYTVVFVRLVLLTSLVNSFASPLAAAKGATGDIKVYQIILTSIGWLHLPISFAVFLLGASPPWAMAIYLGLSVVMQGFRVGLTCHSIGLNVRRFFSQVLCRCLIVLVLSVAIPSLIVISFPRTLLVSIMDLGAGVLMVSLSVLCVGLNKRERGLIIDIVKTKLKR